ncbi:MAG TPA: nucleotide exchange factor GrpE, partial [Kofleriaceae bacterium]|nr:nucleotide exchange factor GrpE [Kofleriaceae bacterium]
ILPVLDNLERAVEHASATQAASAGEAGMLEGLRLVMRQFATAFERLDVTAIVAEGQPFDPNLHEAISQQETADAAAGTVLSVLQRGYKAGDKLLRPALVVVAKAKA